MDKGVISEEMRKEILICMRKTAGAERMILPILISLEKVDYDYKVFKKNIRECMEGVWPGGGKKAFDMLNDIISIPFDELPLYINDPDNLKQALAMGRLKAGI